MVLRRKNKVCSKCGEPKSSSEFHKQRSTSDGLKSACKSCRHLARAATWKKYKTNSTSEERRVRYLKNKSYVKEWMSDPANKERTRIRKLERRRRITVNSTLEERRERRAKKRGTHKRAKRKYNIRIKQEKLESEIKVNKELYLIICGEIVQGLTHQEIQLKYDLSKRFLKRLIKYKGNCYKKETVIDRIKPILDKEYDEKGFREYSWDWLLSPISGCRMRVDLFYPINNLVVEFNGPQHYREIGYGNLAEVQLRDNVKYSLIEDRGFHLRIITKEDEILNDRERFQ